VQREHPQNYDRIEVGPGAHKSCHICLGCFHHLCVAVALHSGSPAFERNYLSICFMFCEYWIEPLLKSLKNCIFWFIIDSPIASLEHCCFHNLPKAMEVYVHGNSCVIAKLCQCFTILVKKFPLLFSSLSTTVPNHFSKIQKYLCRLQTRY